MKDKSRNRTWGGVLTPCPIIILFQTAADSSDVITWQARAATTRGRGIWTPTRGKWHVFTGRLHHLWLQPQNGVHIHRRPPSVSLRLSRPLFPLTSSRPSETREQTSLSAAHLLFCLCPFIRRVFSLLLCFSPAVRPRSQTASKK